jgi:copper homeostasis protein
LNGLDKFLCRLVLPDLCVLRSKRNRDRLELLLESIMNQVLLELCVESLAAGQAAQAGGADRIELCAQLDRGGVTPCGELKNGNLKALSIPVYVLIRPRTGDFCFSAGEFDQMRRQIEQAREAGADGIAVGVLHRDGRVDVERTGALVELARPLTVTFHRAFDETPDLEEALERVIETGAENLLTSGGASDVLRGAEFLKSLRDQADGRIQIIAGGGLRLESLVEVVRRSGIFSLHGSLTRKNGHRAADGNGSSLESDVREALRLLNAEYTAAMAPTLKN